MTKKKLLIFGSNGMLGSEFLKVQLEDFELIAANHALCDITDMSSVQSIIDKVEPDVVLNCAAYTRVDDAEDVGANKNYMVNAYGVYNIAKTTQAQNIDFVTISTDYVFDGIKHTQYLPSDIPNPINAYGRAKWIGERLAISENPRTIIVRTSWLYGGSTHGNFVRTILRLAGQNERIRVVDDQFGFPTYTNDLVSVLGSITQNIYQHRGQILHVCNSSSEAISWAQFAKKIMELKGLDSDKIVPCTSDEYKTKAYRPKNSSLRSSFNNIRSWDSALESYLNSLS